MKKKAHIKRLQGTAALAAAFFNPFYEEVRVKMSEVKRVLVKAFPAWKKSQAETLAYKRRSRAYEVRRIKEDIKRLKDEIADLRKQLDEMPPVPSLKAWANGAAYMEYVDGCLDFAKREGLTAVYEEKGGRKEPVK